MCSNTVKNIAEKHTHSDSQTTGISQHRKMIIIMNIHIEVVVIPWRSVIFHVRSVFFIISYNVNIIIQKPCNFQHEMFLVVVAVVCFPLKCLGSGNAKPMKRNERSRRFSSSSPTNNIYFHQTISQLWDKEQKILLIEFLATMNMYFVSTKKKTKKQRIYCKYVRSTITKVHIHGKIIAFQVNKLT